MADSTYGPLVYMEQGGDQQIVASGGEILIETGGKFSANAGTVTLVSNAGTLSAVTGKITTESLSTAAGASQALTITNTLCAAADTILVTINGGTNTNGAVEAKAVPGAGSFVITLTNRHASAAFNGTFILGFLIIKASS